MTTTVTSPWRGRDHLRWTVLTAIAVGSVAVVGLLACPSQAQPAQAANMYRIGYVSLAGSPNHPGTLAFRQELVKAGYGEGKNVIIEARFAEGRQERLRPLVADVLRLNVDVLVVTSTSTALVAKQATTTTPIVFASVFDPVGAGIVTSLARPGGNITGAAIGVGEGFGGKWLELLKEAVPAVSRVAVLWNSANRSSAQSVQELHAAARPLGVSLDLFDAGSAVNMAKTFAVIGVDRPHGMIVAPDPYFNTNRAKLVQLAASKRLPAVYFFTSFAEAGGLLAYGPVHEDSFRKAALYVDKILKGAKPADLPVEQPTRFELVLNMKTAKELGLRIPQSLLLRADRVIE